MRMMVSYALVQQQLYKSCDDFLRYERSNSIGNSKSGETWHHQQGGSRTPREQHCRNICVIFMDSRSCRAATIMRSANQWQQQQQLQQQERILLNLHNRRYDASMSGQVTMVPHHERREPRSIVETWKQAKYCDHLSGRQSRLRQFCSRGEISSKCCNDDGGCGRMETENSNGLAWRADGMQDAATPH